MNTTISSSFSTQDFSTLEIMSQRAIYQEANESHNVELVRQLNDLGMQPKVPSFSGPTIISNFMDIATKYDTILGFLKELRQSNRLLTEQEFQSLSTKKWIQKSKISRILGCDHLMQKIAEKELKHMKIPLKIAVVEDAESLKVSGWEYSDNLYDLDFDQVKIFAEKIKPIERKLSRDEIDELIQVIATANFLDLWPENIVVAEDGAYFIDTEFKSFAGSIYWGKLGRFESLVGEKDKVYFKEKVEEKMNEPEIIKENNGYGYLRNILRMFKRLPESSLEETDRKEIEEMESKIYDLEYVGAKEAGSSWMKPNKFTFNLKDILT
jgi:hypothetical protein